mgnify:CR=1 FL=1
MQELTQDKHYEMADKIFNVVAKYYPDAELYTSIEGKEQALIVAHWFRLDEAIGNKWKAEAIGAAMEKFDVVSAFEDEIERCDICATAVETQPTSWSWQPNFIRDEHMELLCRNCVEAMDEEELEDVIAHFSCAVKALPDWMKKQLDRIGFVCLENDDMACARFESGFFPGQNDDPERVAEDLDEKLPHHEYVFVLNSVGQFDMDWSVWVRRFK